MPVTYGIPPPIINRTSETETTSETEFNIEKIIHIYALNPSYIRRKKNKEQMFFVLKLGSVLLKEQMFFVLFLKKEQKTL